MIKAREMRKLVSCIQLRTNISIILIKWPSSFAWILQLDIDLVLKHSIYCLCQSTNCYSVWLLVVLGKFYMFLSRKLRLFSELWRVLTMSAFLFVGAYNMYSHAIIWLCYQEKLSEQLSLKKHQYLFRFLL